MSIIYKGYVIETYLCNHTVYAIVRNVTTGKALVTDAHKTTNAAIADAREIVRMVSK